MALNLVRGVPLTPKEKETMLDILTPPPPPRRWPWERRQQTYQEQSLRLHRAFNLTRGCCSFFYSFGEIDAIIQRFCLCFLCHPLQFCWAKNLPSFIYVFFFSAVSFVVVTLKPGITDADPSTSFTRRERFQNIVCCLIIPLAQRERVIMIQLHGTLSWYPCSCSIIIMAVSIKFFNSN